MATPVLPRVAIAYCTQCKWGLRAAYYAQELLSTFGTTIGEVAMIPASGGLFTVRLTYAVGSAESDGQARAEEVLIWDRKTESGFPETKILKQLIRNKIEPEKNLGHSDTPSSKASAKTAADEPAKAEAESQPAQSAEKCEDCS
ncbi:selenoprotein domain protein [Zymoseptoria brevis]|uniref:Selenoprotein domain protein n=1 Tax=Zymoseptoria brevis TaxID=1047168 RepID=A0A0F4GD91_9PEZI|nr:selenoprotein domain protein [Zymoseptoria brevis]